MDPKPTRVPLETTPPSLPAPPAATEPEAAVSAGPPLSAEQIEDVQEQVVAALRSCYDPEIPVNIYELGLIYGVEVAPTGTVNIRMTLTSPACPVAGSLPPEVQAKVGAIPGVTAAKVDLVWHPPWDQSPMSEAAKLQLGLFD